ncbi:MAG: orotidine 5'-phosphate decarboxylase [Candidatus Altiarchaeota archaeon]|nr:orotidine 5'-phosphate decarboxylase [Candidatus Altiarchaeota archaeon]
MKRVIQLALDYVDYDRAVKAAREASSSVDWIEAGTPLIKSEGLDVVRKLKAEFPGKTIVADLKVMDAGRMEVEAAAKAGADVVDVCAAADDSTVRECVEAGRNYGVMIACDLIGVKDAAARAREVEKLGVDYIIVHMGIDEQMRGGSLSKKVASVVKAVGVPVAAAGGLNSENIAEVAKAGPTIFVVGGSITKSEDARKAAMAIRKSVDSMNAVKTKLYKRSVDVRKVLARVSSANVSDAMHRTGDLVGINPLLQGAKIVGKAITVRSYPGDWSKPVQAIDAAEPGDVIVITTGGVGPAVWGELATESALQKKIAGIVVDGAVRDVDSIRKLKFPAYSRLVSPTAGEPKGFGEINVPIQVGSVGINPGDWIIADD